MHVADCLKKRVKSGQRLTLGLSGGVDSIVLLDVLARIAPRMRFVLEAVHVNHQLSPNAASWARFCRRQCRMRGVHCRVVKVQVERGNSVEAAAREARYGAFATARADYLVLAHNRDDQAETVLLQLLRGTGVKGLAGMPAMRSLQRSPSPNDPSSLSGALLLRPLLDVPRAHIQRYAERHKLEWVHDESNVDTSYTRNWIRHAVLPHIAERLPHWRESLVRAARNMREAGELLDALAAIDFTAAEAGGGLRVDVLRSLPDARVRNVLRFWIDRCGWSMPDSSRVAEAARQALGARRDARVVVNLGPCELRRHGEVVHLLARRGQSPLHAVVTWQGERRVELPDGVLTMSRAKGTGISAARLRSAPVTIRPRRGGERLQLAGNRPRRTVKNLLQEACVPPWQRERLPLIFCGEALVCVPGVGVDWRFQPELKEPSIVASWLTHSPAPGDDASADRDADPSR